MGAEQPPRELSPSEAVTSKWFCMKCKKELSIRLSFNFDSSFYCQNPDCEHYGVLVVGGLIQKAEESKDGKRD